jgi:acyl-CoA thioester hydrolase
MGMMQRGDDGVRGISAGMTVSFLAESHWPGQI